MPIDTTTRRAPTWLMIVVAVLLLPWSWFVNVWYTGRDLYVPLLEASGGLLHPSLQVCLPTVILLLLLFRVAELAPRDVGLRTSTLGVGVGATLLLWGLVHVVACAATGGELVGSDHGGKTPGLVAGHLLGQLLGNALYEELVFRGLFLAQLVLILRARGQRPWRVAWTAALLSAVIFALPHVPNRMMKGDYDGVGSLLADQGRLLGFGLFFAWVYLRTVNLWWTIGLHALMNYPTLLLDWGRVGSPKAAVVALGLAITGVWPWVARRRRGGARSCGR